MSDVPLRYPKVHSPYKRAEDSNGNYVVDPDGEFLGVKEDYEWVFENSDVTCVEKLHGTNGAVRVEWGEEGPEIDAYTRHGPAGFNEVEPFGSTHHRRITRAVQNSLRRGYLDRLDDGTGGFDGGVHYGEIVGPDFHGNMHELDENLFIPFQWLERKCSYNSWGKYPKDFETIRGWLKDDLFSLFHSAMHGTDLTESSVSNGTFVEGLMFLHPDHSYTESGITTKEEMTSGGMYRKVQPNIAKIRRDMFTGYQNGEWPMVGGTDH